MVELRADPRQYRYHPNETWLRFEARLKTRVRCSVDGDYGGQHFRRAECWLAKGLIGMMVYASSEVRYAYEIRCLTGVIPSWTVLVAYEGGEVRNKCHSTGLQVEEKQGATECTDVHRHQVAAIRNV